MGVWNTATPAGSDPRSQGDDRIRELKVAIQEFLRGGTTDGLEAVFPGAAPTTAPVFHYRGLKGTTAARPAALEGGLYFNTTTGTIQRADGSVWLDLTENAAYEAIHQAVGASLASVTGVVTLPETGNSFNVSGTEAVTSIAGWSAGVVVVKWTQARTLTHGASLYLMEALSRVVSANDVSVFEFTGSNAVREISFHGAKLLPTRQVLTSGTAATYTTPTGARQIKVRMVGAGGGGGAAVTNAGAAGGDTTFNSLVAAGGSGGTAGDVVNANSGAGGSGGAGTVSFRSRGGAGESPSPGSGRGGAGGSSLLGGGGYTPADITTGNSADANTGGGGSGASASGNGGGGGGAGEYVEFIISNPSATYTYTITAGGAGGTAGTYAGGAGGSGLIIVDEEY